MFNCSHAPKLHCVFSFILLNPVSLGNCSIRFWFKVTVEGTVGSSATAADLCESLNVLTVALMDSFVVVHYLQMTHFSPSQPLGLTRP